MADKYKAVNNTDNKRHLSDTSRSFSDVVRTPKKKKGKHLALRYRVLKSTPRLINL